MTGGIGAPLHGCNVEVLSGSTIFAQDEGQNPGQCKKWEPVDTENYETGSSVKPL